jgi:hypothetical protein
MIRQRGWEELNEMVKGLNNKSVIMEFFANARFSPTVYQAYVRGKMIDYSPDAINSLLGLTPPEECEVQRLRREAANMPNSEWDELLAKMHRRPITGSYERFDKSRERMDAYFAHQERFAAFMKKEITDDFEAGEKRVADDFFDGLPAAGSDEDLDMGLDH